MAKQYYGFTKKHFEYELRGITIRNGMKFPVDITEEWKASGKDTWEHIYKIPTKNPAVDIIIFSSVDMTENKVRKIGSDAVRVVTRWITKKGERFKAVHTHYRIKTLFKNLENTLVNEIKMVFNLNWEDFTDVV